MKHYGFTKELPELKGDSFKHISELNEMTAFELQERDCYFLHPEYHYPSVMSQIKKSRRSPYIKFVAYGQEFKYHAVTIRTTPGMFCFDHLKLDRQAKEHVKIRIEKHRKAIKELKVWLYK